MIADPPARSVALPADRPARLAGWRRVARVPRPLRGLASDGHVLLALSLAISVLVAEILSRAPGVGEVALAAAGYVGLQIALGRPVLRVPGSALAIGRLALALGFVTFVGLVGGDVTLRPIGTLYIPVVAMAAMLGRREAIAIGGASLLLYVVPRLLDPISSQAVVERTSVLVGTAIVIAVGTRRTVGSLQRARDKARRAMAEDRRRGRQLAGAEAIGRLLAKAGPTREALDEVMGLLETRLGYRYPSIYLRDGDDLRLGAQRGYPEPIEIIPATRGVVGRVVRTGVTAYVPDVRLDPDYVSANDEIESEISVPIAIGDELVGVVNVESTSALPLDENDVASMTLVADRLASALALAREREALARRAQMFERLTTVAARLSASLEPTQVASEIGRAVAEVVPADFISVVIRDGTDEAYRLMAVHGADGKFNGVRVEPGEGMAGRAIAERAVVIDEEFRQDKFPASIRPAIEPMTLTAVAVPLLHDDDVIGAVSLARLDRSHRFDALELEALPMLGVQGAVAIRNAQLMNDIRETSIRDSLTGLYNRRHFDASVERLVAARRRLPAEQRRPVSVILFDLDHFGELNKRHGHAVGDAVLRAFAGIIRDRFRTSDIVARFGGEEFVAVLDGATRDDAMAAAESVRAALAAVPIEAPGGITVRATVSAGCASLADNATAAAGLLQVADVGLAMAKQAGRDQVVAA